MIVNSQGNASRMQSFKRTLNEILDTMPKSQKGSHRHNERGSRDQGSSSRHDHTQDENHHSNSSRPTKMEFPRCVGEDPKMWLDQVTIFRISIDN
jgi:hypothetical protein